MPILPTIAPLQAKKPYVRPALIPYGDINTVTQDLASGDLLSVGAVAVL